MSTSRGERPAGMHPRGSVWQRVGTVAAFALSLGLAVAAPFVLMAVLRTHGLDISRWLYGLAAGITAINALILLAGGLANARLRRDPPEVSAPCPLASAVVVAPDGAEPDAVRATVDSVLDQEYAGPLRVVIAHGGSGLPGGLADPAIQRRAETAVIALPMTDAASRPEMIASALKEARGDFVGIFDAGQTVAPGSFERARRWMGSGSDVAYGHQYHPGQPGTWVSCCAAVESSSPGVEGWSLGRDGSRLLPLLANSFWRMHLARRAANPDGLGERIPLRLSCDRGLEAWTPAPQSFGEVRAGWREHDWHWLGLVPSLRLPPCLPRVQRFIGSVWEPAWVWLSALPLAIAGYWLLWRRIGWGHPKDLVPIAVLVLLYVLLDPIVRATLAYAMAPRTNRRWTWFALYGVLCAVFLGGMRNSQARVTQLLAMLGPGRRPSDRPAAVPDDLTRIGLSDSGPWEPIRAAVGAPDVASRRPAERSAGVVRPSGTPHAVSRSVDVDEQDAQAPVTAPRVQSPGRETLSILTALTQEIQAMETRLAGSRRASHELYDRIRQTEESTARTDIRSLDGDITSLDALLHMAQRLAGEPDSITALSEVAAHAGDFQRAVAAYERLQTAFMPELQGKDG